MADAERCANVLLDMAKEKEATMWATEVPGLLEGARVVRALVA